MSDLPPIPEQEGFNTMASTEAGRAMLRAHRAKAVERQAGLRQNIEESQASIARADEMIRRIDKALGSDGEVAA